MNARPEIKIDFANRQRELSLLLTSDAASIIVDAPPGFGKTYFLLQAKQQFDKQAQVSNSPPWKSAYLDLDSYQGSQAMGALQNDLIRDLTGQKPITDLSYLELRQQLQAINQPLRIFFDSAGGTPESTLADIKELTAKLCQDLPSDRIQVIIAERYSKLQGGDGRTQIISLQPFTQVTVLHILKKISQQIHPPYEIPQDRYERWAEGIVQLSGGHPKVISNLVIELANGGWIANYEREDEQKDLYHSCVKDEIVKVLGNIEEPLLKDIRSICIFRFFSFDTVAYLQSSDKLQTKAKGLAVYHKLIKTKLFQLDRVHFKDSLVRNLLSSEMKISDPDRYREMNRAAYNFYGELIDRLIENIDNPGSDAPTRVPVYVKEGIFHFIQFTQDIMDISYMIQSYGNHLKIVGEADESSCAGKIESYLKGDWEIASLLGKEKIETIIQLAFGPSTQLPKPRPANIRILFLAANPINKRVLEIEREIDSIKEKIQALGHNQSPELILAHAVRPDQLVELFDRHRPHIVHFSGHSNLNGELILENEHREPAPVSPEIVRRLFSAVSGNIRLVVLNACYTWILAQAITEKIECVVGMTGKIEDEAAITFASFFYKYLVSGCSVWQACDYAKVALSLNWKSRHSEEIPREYLPVVHNRKDVAPDKVFITQATN